MKFHTGGDAEGKIYALPISPRTLAHRAEAETVRIRFADSMLIEFAFKANSNAGQIDPLGQFVPPKRLQRKFGSLGARTFGKTCE